MPIPVSVTHSERYCPSGISCFLAARSSSHRLAVSMVMRPPVRHRISGIEAEIQQRIFELGRVDEYRPDTARADSLDE